jgi:hypothetical protein
MSDLSSLRILSTPAEAFSSVSRAETMSASSCSAIPYSVLKRKHATGNECTDRAPALRSASPSVASSGSPPASAMPPFASVCSPGRRKSVSVGAPVGGDRRTNLEFPRLALLVILELVHVLLKFLDLRLGDHLLLLCSLHGCFHLYNRLP